MAESQSEKITRLCDAWITAATSVGGISLGVESEQHRLGDSGIIFHELDFAAICATTVGLSKVLLLPNLNAVIVSDHCWFWSWCGEVLLGTHSPYRAALPREINALASLAIRASLASFSPPVSDSMERSRVLREILPQNASEFLAESQLALPYIAFPLLEAMVKLSCPSFIDLAGVVVAPFDRRKGKAYKVGGVCSSVADLLNLLVNVVAGSGLKADLVCILDQISGLGTMANGYEQLYAWRNSSLHGQASFQTIGGIVLMLAIRIGLENVSQDYDLLRKKILHSVDRDVSFAHQSGRWSPARWQFYPLHP